MKKKKIHICHYLKKNISSSISSIITIKYKIIIFSTYSCLLLLHVMPNLV